MKAIPFQILTNLGETIHICVTKDVPRQDLPMKIIYSYIGSIAHTSEQKKAIIQGASEAERV